MKAAIIKSFGEVPQYQDFPDPIAAAGDALIHVKASVLENFDKGTARGTHYSSHKLFPQFPAIVGTDGIGTTEDGKLVGFGGLTPPYGAFAEKAVARRVTPIPDGIDPSKAAALPRSILTSLLPLKYSAWLQPGETVLINGATGVSGRIAVQVAKMLGAGKIIGTGRNEKSLHLLPQLGADTVIDISRPDENIREAFAAEDASKKIDVVLDFLWGHPAELLINTFIPKEVGFARRTIRYVQVGEKAGSQLALPAAALRTSGLQLMGIGMIPMEALGEEMTRVWNWVREDKFYMEIERVPLAEIATAWQRENLAGKRLVIIP